MLDQPRPPLPGSVIVVALLSIVLGVIACHDVYSDWQRHLLSINLGVLMLPLGLGVLIRSNASRVVLAAFLLLGLILGPLLLCIISAGGFTGHMTFYVTWFGKRVDNPDAGQVVASYGLALARWLVDLWAYRVLRSERTRAAFGLPPRFAV